MAALACNDKQKIREHYDVVSPYYQALWGEHIHHGYWIRGDETKEVAQLQLVERLAQAACIRDGCKILDVGCGIGASSIYLAKCYQAEVTGITISPVQLEMANRAAKSQNARVKFLLMDAEAMQFEGPFDVLWAVESISHLQDVPAFFAAAAKLLRQDGTLALIDWFKRENATPQEERDPLSAAITAEKQRKIIAPIEQSMLVELRTMQEYQQWMGASGFYVTHCEILNEHCARTWDICFEMIKDKKLWELAAKHGSHFLAHLRGFRAMRAGFASGAFVYGLLVAQKR